MMINLKSFYNNPLFYPDANVKCTDIFKVGDYAYAIEGSVPYYVRALITDFNSSTQSQGLAYWSLCN